MINSKPVFLVVVAGISLVIPSDVYATGIRFDYPEDGEASEESNECYLNGYDSGFAGKYDKDKARECIEHGDYYNELWTLGCEDSLRTEEECGELINNPVEIEDYEALKGENNITCYVAGQEDGAAGKPFNKDRSSGCDEFGGYRGGYQWGCEQHTTESTCELKYENKRNYCPDHPDIVGCVDFLNNATNKMTENRVPACAGMDHMEYIICPQEVNPEKYCLQFDNPTFCRTIGDLCDDEGFVRPEYPYCYNGFEDAGSPGNNNDDGVPGVDQVDPNDDSNDLPRCKYGVVQDCVVNDLGQVCEVGTSDDPCQDVFYGYGSGPGLFNGHKRGETVASNNDNDNNSGGSSSSQPHSSSDNMPECKRDVLQDCKLSGNTGLLCGVEDLTQQGDYNPNVIGEGHACHDVYIGTYNQLYACNDGTYAVSCGSIGVLPGIP